jgi:hypothetical protein
VSGRNPGRALQPQQTPTHRRSEIGGGVRAGVGAPATRHVDRAWIGFTVSGSEHSDRESLPYVRFTVTGAPEQSPDKRHRIGTRLPSSSAIFSE